MGQLTIILLLALCTMLCNGQDSCTAYTKQGGACRIITECPALLKFLTTEKTKENVNNLLESQKICGNRSSGRNPIVCCPNANQPAANPPPAVNPQPAVNIQPTTAANTATDCNAANKTPGKCIKVEECPRFSNVNPAGQKREAFKQFLTKSKQICQFAKTGTACCPMKATTTTDSNEPDPQPAVSDPPLDITTVKGLFTAQQGCGYSNVTHPRVVGGVPSEIGGWPWMALLGYRSDFGDVSFKCGGSLISRRHILTAAHCMRKDLALVRLGEHDLSTPDETKFIERDVIQQIIHPNYDRKDGNSDMAILVLEDPVNEFTYTIRPICIPLHDPERSQSFEGRNPFVAGWGRTTEGGKAANVLQEVQFPVLKNEDCKVRYQNLGRLQSEKQFNEATLCAGELNGGKDACQGDSGGPLMVPIKYGNEFHYFQIGVVSYGIGCARADVPGVYTRVQYFADWINQQVEST